LEIINRAFIAKPHFFKPETQFKINNSKIEYTDVLTYVALRSFHNVKSNSCFPALQTIAKKAGISKKFVTKSIERLESAEFINVMRSGKLRIGNRYAFRKFQHFDRIPIDIFKCNDLSLYEKSMLLCLRELGITPVDINCSKVELADKLNITYKTLYCQLTSLISKGYVQKDGSNWYRLNKIDWHFENRSKDAQPEPTDFYMSDYPKSFNDKSICEFIMG